MPENTVNKKTDHCVTQVLNEYKSDNLNYKNFYFNYKVDKNCYFNLAN